MPPNPIVIPTSFTVEDYQAVEAMIASGLSTVRFSNGEEYRYGSTQEKLLILDVIRRALVMQIENITGARSTFGVIIPRYRSGYHRRDCF